MRFILYHPTSWSKLRLREVWSHSQTHTAGSGQSHHCAEEGATLT